MNTRAATRAAKRRASSAMTPPDVARPTPHVSFLGDDAPDASEHGERAPAPREDTLLGTSGSHTPAPDERAEEPFGELAPSAAAEGDDA